MELFKYRYNIYNYLFLNNLDYTLTIPNLRIKKIILYLIIALFIIIFSFQHREMNILILIFTMIMLILYYYKLFDKYKEEIWNFIYGILILVFLSFLFTNKTINSQLILFIIFLITFIYFNEKVLNKFDDIVNDKSLNQYKNYYELLNKIEINNKKILDENLKEYDKLNTYKSKYKEFNEIIKKNIKHYENLLDEDIDDFIDALIINNDILKYIDISNKYNINNTYLYIYDKALNTTYYTDIINRVYIRDIDIAKILDKDLYIYEITLDRLHEKRNNLEDIDMKYIYDDIMNQLKVKDLDILFKNYENIDNKLFEKYNQYINMYNYLILSIILLVTMILHIFFHYFV